MIFQGPRRAMQASIDGYVLLDRYSRHSGRAFPRAFFLALAVALETSPQLVAALQGARISFTADDIRDMLRYAEAYLPLADELDRFARAIRHSVGLRRAKIGLVATSAYRIAQGLNRLVEVPLPVPEVDAMKCALTWRRRKPAKATP